MTSPSDARRDSVMLGLLFGLVGLGSSSAAIAVPVVADHFEVGVGTATWTVSAYLLALAVSTPVYGRLSDIFGARLPLLAGVSLMSVGAVAAAMATAYPVLVAARVLQGIGAAAVPTLAVIVLSARYEGALRGLALGTLSAVAASLGCLGPLAGGLTEEAAGWRGVMALPVLSLLVLVPVWRHVAGGGSGARLDLWGAALVATTSAGVVLLLQSPATGAVVAGVGAVLVVAGLPLVVRRVHRHPHGFLPLDVVRNGSVVRAAATASAMPAVWFAMLVVVPAVLVADGWAPWHVGLLLLPGAAGSFAAPRLAGALLHRHGGETTLVVASLIAIAALLLGVWGAAVPTPAPLGASVALVTLAFGLGQPAMTSVVSDAVPHDIRGAALGVATLIFLVGGSIGTAWVAGVGALVGIPMSLVLFLAFPVTGALVLARVSARGRPAGCGTAR